MFKRSHVEAGIRACMRLAGENGIRLPDFAYWTVADWKRRAAETGVMRQVHMGWNVTDFGRGQPFRLGTCSITLRNGLPGGQAGVPYCEKLGYFRDGGQLALHLHHQKQEDIICRSKTGRFWFAVWSTREDLSLNTKDAVEILSDGIPLRCEPGRRYFLAQGNSITVTPGTAHAFGAQAGGGDLLYGEVSTVNDDQKDNHFYAPLTRFSAIGEDVETTIPMSWETDAL